MSTAYLGLGSNVNARSNIASGISALKETFTEVVLSPVYQSGSVGFDGADFINLVARIETAMSPLELKHFLNELEDRHGRKRDVPKFSDRTLDIDILLFDDLKLKNEDLDIPRNEILTSAHVLKPLADLAPDLQHPESEKTIAGLWAEFPGKKNQLQLIKLEMESE